MKKTLLLLICTLPIFGIATQIDELKHHLKEEELKETNQEVDAQKYMIGDWDAYSTQLEEVDKELENSEKTRKEIKKLEQHL